MQRVDRRQFLRKGATAGAGLAAAGVLSSLGFSAFGRGLEATALTPDDARRDNRGHGPEASSLGVIDNTGVRARLGILSDTHLCGTDSTAANKLAVALETLSWAAPDIDAFFILGDVTCDGNNGDLEAFASQATEGLLTHYSATPALHLIMGNHDYLQGTEASFESFFARHEFSAFFTAEQNTVALLSGITAIKLNGASDPAVDKMDYTVSYDFLAEALEEAATNRPSDAILIMAHEPPEDMSLPLGIESGYYGQEDTSKDMVELITKYPQARMFSGHIHNPLDIPETINTDLGFTSVHTSTVGSCFFVRNEQVDYEQEGSHGLVLDVKEDGSLLLHRIDFTNQAYFGEPVAI